MKELKMEIISFLFVVGIGFIILNVYLSNRQQKLIKQEKKTIDSIAIQQRIVDCYMDSCNHCKESELKNFGEILEIEQIKLRNLKNK